MWCFVPRDQIGGNSECPRSESGAAIEMNDSIYLWTKFASVGEDIGAAAESATELDRVSELRELTAEAWDTTIGVK